MTKDEMLDMIESPTGRYVKVWYSKRVEDKVLIPSEIIEHEPEFDDEDLVEWIAKNNDDAEDMQITDIDA